MLSVLTLLISWALPRLVSLLWIVGAWLCSWLPIGAVSHAPAAGMRRLSRAALGPNWSSAMAVLRAPAARGLFATQWMLCRDGEQKRGGRLVPMGQLHFSPLELKDRQLLAPVLDPVLAVLNEFHQSDAGKATWRQCIRMLLQWNWSQIGLNSSTLTDAAIDTAVDSSSTQPIDFYFYEWNTADILWGETHRALAKRVGSDGESELTCKLNLTVSFRARAEALCRITPSAGRRTDLVHVCVTCCVVQWLRWLGEQLASQSMQAGEYAFGQQQLLLFVTMLHESAHVMLDRVLFELFAITHEQWLNNREEAVALGQFKLRTPPKAQPADVEPTTRMPARPLKTHHSEAGYLVEEVSAQRAACSCMVAVSVPRLTACVLATGIVFLSRRCLAAAGL